MPNHTHIVLMADIQSSRGFEQKKLLKEFMLLTKNANLIYQKNLRSPLTITLGDEFQGVPKSLSSAINIILFLEEEIIQQKWNFKLRYTIGEGVIETAINTKNAHGMMGAGLTETRQQLELLKKDKDSSRFLVHIHSKELNALLNSTFFVYQSFVDEWRPDKDYSVVGSLLKYHDYKEAAAHLHQDPSQVWKRQKTLNFKAYTRIKSAIQMIAEQGEKAL